MTSQVSHPGAAIAAEAVRADHRAADAEGGRQAPQGQPVLAGQGAHARRRAAVHQASAGPIRYSEAALLSG